MIYVIFAILAISALVAMFFFGKALDELHTLTIRLSQLNKEKDKYIDAIRHHKDEKGDDRCWMDDERLYNVLPEGYTPPVRDTAVELKNCKRYIENRKNPATEYVSPDTEISILRESLRRIRGILAKHPCN